MPAATRPSRAKASTSTQPAKAKVVAPKKKAPASKTAPTPAHPTWQDMIKVNTELIHVAVYTYLLRRC